jgi:HPr kinase/phosphorylase
VNLPYLVLPVKPGRDIVMLLETIALNHRLKRMGYNSAQEFSSKVLALTMQKKVDLKRKNK